jgi:hypothetical protein
MSADGTTADRCRFRDLCIDATDQHRLAAFRAAALGLGAGGRRAAALDAAQ